jgi:O-antigen ligase
VPFLFLHVDFQPSLAVGSLSLALSDVAVLAVAVVAALVARRDGFGVLARPRAVWLACGAFLAYLLAAAVYPLAWRHGLPAGARLASAAKFDEYALLAPAAVVLLRTRRDLGVLLGALVAWSVVATAIGLAQYLGLDAFEAWGTGRRQPSLLGVHEFASFSGAVLVLALVALVRPPVERRWRQAAVVAAISGGLGLVLSGAIAAGLGLGLAAVALALYGYARGTLDLRRLAAGGALVAVVALGLVTIRSGDLTDLAHFVGGTGESPAQQARVQTYSQRTLMTYVAYRMWRERPLLGVGWSGATDPANFEPQLAAAHRRFPDQPPLAFPSRAHPWPIDDAYVQALAELGILGTLVFLAFLATVLVVGARAALRRGARPEALIGTALVLLAIGVWTGQGLSPGIPHDAVAWLAVGLIATAVARA